MGSCLSLQGFYGSDHSRVLSEDPREKGLEGKESYADERHSPQGMLNVLPGGSPGMQLPEGRSTKTVNRETRVHRTLTYTKSVHWTSFFKSFIFRRKSGARTSKIHLSVS